MAETALNQDALKILEEYNNGIKKIEPVNSGLIPNPDQKDFNFWQKAGRLGLSAGQGVVNAAEETLDFLDENIVMPYDTPDTLLGKVAFTDFIPRFITPKKWNKPTLSQSRQLPIFHQPEGLAENMTEGASRFVAGFIGPNKFFKTVGLGGGIVKTGLRGMAAGGVSDLTVFDPNEGRLSDMLVEFDSPVLNNAVTQYLATDEDDTEMEGRLKNVLEGMLIGGPFEILFGLKAFKKAKATKDFAEKEKIYKETGEAISDLKKGKKTKKVLKQIAENNNAINMKQYLKKLNIGQKEAKAETESFIKKILNTKSLKNSAQVLKTIDDVAERFDETTKDYLQNDVLKNSEAEELATLMSRDKGEILKALPKEGERAKTATVRMIASKQILQELAFQLKNTAEGYIKKFGTDKKNWTKQAQEEVALQSELVRNTVVALKDQIRGAARVTQAGNIKVARSEGKILDLEKMVDIIKNYEGDVTVMSRLMKDANLETVINDVSKTRGQKVIEAFNSAYINSLLSGVFTQAINMKSGIYEALIRPLEQITGGIVRADTKAIRLGFAQYSGMMMHMGDVVKATHLALKQGDAILDPLARTQDNLEIVNGKAIRPISGANLGFDGSAGTAIDWLGKVIELPSRLLMTGDEFLKQSNYRGRLYTNALENTMERGLDITSKEGKANIDRIFKEGFTKNGNANVKDSSINEAALQYARESTYTNTLRGGSYLDWGAKVQTFLNNSPEFRFMAPFIRTPTNLWRHMSNRIPGLGVFTKQNQDLWRSGDRRARAEVLGRQMFGTSIAFYGFHLATEDIEDKNGNFFPKITGNGPANFQIKKTWLANGWQPYSIAQKNKDGSITYKQYNRMDPRFMIYGWIADIKENLANINDEDKESIFTAAILTVMRNAANKTYLRGISDVAELIGDPTENKVERFVGGVVGNLIPYASLRNQGIPGILEPEKEAYETRGFVDQILSRTGLGEKYLEPRRDIITGEPIERTPSSLYFNPEGVISFSSLLQGPSLVGKKIDTKDNPVAFEIARLRVALTPPQKVISRIVDLTEFKKGKQTAYDYLMENTGKVKINGRTFQEEMINQMNSTFYKNLQDQADNVNFDTGKDLIIKEVFKGYKDAAYAKMIKEYPEVKEALIQATKQKYENLGKRKGEESDQINMLLPR
jgi:hypothetical protein